MYTYVKTIQLFVMITLMTEQLQAGSGSTGGDPDPAAPVTFAADASSFMKTSIVSLEVLPEDVLNNLAGFLDPKHAVALRQTSKASPFVTQKHMADHVINTIVSGGTPNASAIKQLGTLDPRVRQGLLKASLQAKFGNQPDHSFKIPNNDVFAADMAVVCGRVDITNPIIAQHIKNYYLLGTPDENKKRKDAIVASIQTDYRTLGDAIRTRLSAQAQGTHYVAPKYVTATMDQLAENREAANAYFAAHSTVTLVLMAPDGNTLTLGLANIPASLKKLSIVGDHITTIGDYFLSACRGLTTLDLSPLSKVTTIGHRFLSGCIGLTTLDLRPLSNVTTIGDHFLASCTGLTTIDLSTLSKVTTIENDFLSFCRGLTTIDLSPLSKVTTIQNGFLAYCTGLTTIDLRLLSKVTTIGNSFLSGCSGLRTLDLSPLSKVITIGNNFLVDCSGLRTLDLSPLSNVITIGDRFLASCRGLTSVDLRPLSNVTTIGNDFLDGCTGLTTLDLSPLSKVITIQNGFLAYCTGLTTIHLSLLSKVTTIGNGFLVGCSGLTPEARAHVEAFKASVHALGGAVAF